ncbi:ATP phosphoribosyltransferase regulatory subunit [filamentous cyanobacterium LEGE 11480]|uniref:ATP phosphoribosyltransferase regulatory subunit n=1 Tax=Romeriopsis navalis LEGE 11480 TaxID=2777977 RepID=A0A928VU65_9CYAN|nr:ATP phosphoribosyltransferase regulatory subunit [Romeriopsis navalis]MBE9032650.1 ATP phosphoribosyltransferase regulatory subunit [Romeriopsis navalis LEGE 11480]
MVYQPPTGARDLLPLDVAQKRWIEKRLQAVFHRWGYHRIITSTLERLDTLIAGGAIDPSTILAVQGAADEQLGLRPELTASIARTAVNRMSVSRFPQRLYYSANVFCRPDEDSHSSQQELFQAGVELLGGGGILADVEVLSIAMDCLANVGLGAVQSPQWQLIVGEAGLTKSLLSVFPERIRQTVRQAIAQLDLTGLEALPLEGALRDRALQMLDLRGEPTAVLQKVSQWDLDASQRQQVERLKTLFELMQASVGEGVKLPIVLDLSLIRTFDYYTGIVFEVASTGGTVQQVLAQGGRYDELLGSYHPQGDSVPGIGFSFQIDELYPVLLAAQQLPQSVPTSDYLVVAQDESACAAALRYAQTLRADQPELRVELNLDAGQKPERAAIIDYAQTRNIAQISWVSAEGITVEPVSQ